MAKNEKSEPINVVILRKCGDGLGVPSFLSIFIPPSTIHNVLLYIHICILKK